LIPVEYQDFIKQAKKEKKFYNPDIKEFKVGVKGKIGEHYLKFKDKRTAEIARRLLSLQLR